MTHAWIQRTAQVSCRQSIKFHMTKTEQIQRKTPRGQANTEPTHPHADVHTPPLKRTHSRTNTHAPTQTHTHHHPLLLCVCVLQCVVVDVCCYVLLCVVVCCCVLLCVVVCCCVFLCVLVCSCELFGLREMRGLWTFYGRCRLHLNCVLLCITAY